MESFDARLLAWYDVHARRLPWRVPPGAGRPPDPYRVWLSEIMLQQTTVAAVKPYFARFLDLWPTVGDLARASEADVMRAWAGLGYYSRARNLKACADEIAARGGFPRTESALRDLPGIGAYTAAAIAAIAFAERAVVVDGNVERVATRHRAIDTPMPKAKVEVRAAMEARTPQERPGDFAQAMMDLGATICTPRSPACALCPVNEDCRAHSAGDVERYPVKAPRKAKPERVGAVFVARRSDGAVLLVRRARAGMLGGMVALPTTGWNAREDGETGAEAAPFPAAWREAGTVRHGFTHFALTLTVWTATDIADSHIAGSGSIGSGSAGSGACWWAASDGPDMAGLPTLFAKAFAVAGGDQAAVPSRSR